MQDPDTIALLMAEMESQCKTLISLLGADNVLLPGSTRYNESLASYFSPQASAVQPLCFVTPQTVSDVSAVVKSLTSHGDSLNFAVRGGGHMWIPKASNSDGGVTVDLRGLNSVELSDDHSSVSVGGGATWDLIYNKLDPLGLSVAGGRVAGVGVSGLTLGGGISYFGPRYGWTSNQATSFEVVLADGSIVKASAQQNADLWKGLRGGANNFGIVTGMDLVTFKQGPLWSILSISPTTVLDQQAKVYGKLMAAEHYDENASFITGWAFSGAAGGKVALHQLVHTEPPNGTEIPPVFKDVLDLPTIPNIGSPAIVANMSTIAQNSVALNPKQASRYVHPFPEKAFPLHYKQAKSIFHKHQELTSQKIPHGNNHLRPNRSHDPRGLCRLRLQSRTGAEPNGNHVGAEHRAAATADLCARLSR